MSQPIIEAVDISVAKRLKKNNVAVFPGLTVMTGPSGSGKTTCASVLFGLLKPSTGSVAHYSTSSGELLQRFDAAPEPTLARKLAASLRLSSSVDIAKDADRSHRIGYIPSEPRALPNMTIIDSLIAVHEGLRGNKIDRRYMEGLVKRLGMTAHMDKYPSELSDGQLQRATVLGAFAHKPAIVFGDEPTSKLDTETGMKMMALIQETTTIESVSAFIVTHNPTVASYADHELHVTDGIVTPFNRSA